LIELLAGTFFLEGIDEHRRRHFTHHRRKGFFVETDLDTASLAVHSQRDVLRGVARDLVGLTALSAVSDRRRHAVDGNVVHARRHARVVVCGAVGYLAVTLFLAWIAPGPAAIAAPIYLLTLATVYPLFNRIRVYAQHAEVGERGTVIAASTASRTVVVDRWSLLDRIFVSSKVMLFHAEHHEHPALPFRQLEQLAVPSTDVNRHAASRLALLARLYDALPSGRVPAAR
jgi:fatty acid desaturase